jgi:hypothetical protein
MFIPPLPEHIVRAAQQLPPINVVVQQPPAGGMPEWIKILLTAVVGAVIGIAGAPIGEAVKQFFVRMGLRKRVRQFLIDELIDNLERAEHALSRILLHAQDTDEDLIACVSLATANIREIHDDQFQHYFAAEKAIVYEIDPDRMLAEFYTRLKQAAEEDPESDLQFRLQFIVQSFKMAVLVGEKLLRQNGVRRAERATIYDDVQKMLREKGNKEM